ncbi:MAG: GxxExxY protein [Chthoniobacter sp.]|uniref:GxxExxY protein n=1 Tax=Chthoniobacter sp. TaxID=2510640 RepID=UPI0032AA77B4
MNRRGAEARRGDEITEPVIGAAIRIHRALGPGLLESAYEECLCYELSKAGLRFERQKPQPVTYENVKLDCGYRLDLVVEDTVIVELKCVEKVLPIHEAQLLTYLKLSGLQIGLLMNFHVPVLRDGLKRVVLNYDPSAPPRLGGSSPDLQA